jgi:histidine triad (HIT) family protein
MGEDGRARQSILGRSVEAGRSASVPSMPSPDCVFCRIVTGDVPSAHVREDDRTLSFLTVEPVTEGHTLVVPKRHARNILDIDDADLTAVALATREVAVWQRERLGCAGVTLYQANEAAGFQTVFHYHVHVVPRYPGDKVANAWRDLPQAGRDDLERVARRLRGDVAQTAR